MPRKTNTDKKTDKRGKSVREQRTPRPKPKIDFTIDALDYKNVNAAPHVCDRSGPHPAAQIYRPARALPAPHDRRHQARAPDAADEVIFPPRDGSCHRAVFL
jgi:hypothetical protein